jgi:hypothetical protein
MPTTEMHSWNLSIQRQLTANWLVSASYVGNETEHIWTSTQANEPQFIAGNCPAGVLGLTAPGACSQPANYDQRRTLSLLDPNKSALIGYLDVFDPGGTQSYNGLVLSVQHRFSGGLTLNGNYTWSHCIGDFYVATQPQNPGTGYQVPGNRRFDRGDCFVDRRGNFNISGAYEVPRFNNHVARVLATGWRVSPILRYLTGAPLTITTGVDRALNNNTTTQRPNQVLADPYAHGFLNYLNPLAFQQPALGTLGNMGTYNVRGPGLFEVDTSLSRVFKIQERKSIEIRGEAYNLPNFFLRGNPNAGAPQGPGQGLSTPTFGQITQVYNVNYALSGGGGPRVVQLAMKFTF